MRLNVMFFARVVANMRPPLLIVPPHAALITHLTRHSQQRLRPNRLEQPHQYDHSHPHHRGRLQHVHQHLRRCLAHLRRNSRRRQVLGRQRKRAARFWQHHTVRCTGTAPPLQAAASYCAASGQPARCKCSHPPPPPSLPVPTSRAPPRRRVSAAGARTTTGRCVMRATCACRECAAHTSMKLGLGYYNASVGIVSPQPLLPSPNISNAAIFAGTVHTCAVASGSM